MAKREIKAIGPTISLIIQSVTWQHAGYRAYLGLPAEYAVKISSFFLDSIGSDSEGTDEENQKARTKARKWKEFPPSSPREKISNKKSDRRH